MAKDLFISEVTSPESISLTSLATNPNVNLDWRIENLGDEDIINPVSGLPAYYDAVYFSADQTLDASDSLIIEYPVNSLAANSSFNYVNNAVNLSSLVGLGTFGYLLFASDQRNQVAETDETNNVVAAAVTITGADLVISGLTVPATFTFNQNINIQWTVTNQGDEATTASYWYDRFIFSQDNIIGNADDVYAGQPYYYPGTLAAKDINNPSQTDNSFTANTSLYVPSRVNSSYKLFVVGDYNNDQPETNESNNTFSVPIVVTGADLVVSSLVAPASLTIGQAATFNWTVTNQGTRATDYSYWYNRFVFSLDDTVGNADDINAGDFYYSGSVLAAIDPNNPNQANNSVSGSNSFNIPTGVNSSYKLFMVADIYNYQQELNENNNSRSTTLPAVSGADLVVLSAPSVTSTAIANSNITVNWTLTNQGNATTTASYLYNRIILSRDTQLGNADDITLSQNYQYYNPIDAGGTTAGTITSILPSNAIGTFNLFVQVDTSSNQPETNEANNISVASTQITIAAPDLTISNVTLPVTASVGESINVTWTLANLGTAPTSVNYWYDRFVLSLDNQLGNSDDIYLTESYRYHNILAAQGGSGDSYQDSFSVTLPNSLNAIGSYKLFVITDSSSNYQGETDETNNSAFSVGTVNISAPNLKVNLTAPTTVTQGVGFDVSWIVNNDSSFRAVADWRDRLYLSTDNILDASDTLVNSSDINTQTPLDGGASYTINRTNLKLSGVTDGNYYLIVKTDEGGNQPETNETDNTAVVQITVNSADLRADSVGALDAQSNSLTAVEFGQAFNVTWAVTNIGAGTANSIWGDRLYLSTDATLSADDVIVTTRSQTRNLAPNGQYSDTTSVTVDFNNPLPTDTNGFVSETEPNDAITQALDLQQNFVPGTGANNYVVKAKGVISSSGEGDFYRIYASPNDQVRLYQYGFDTYLFLYDRNGNLLRQDDDGGGSLNSLINYTFPADAYAGDYYVRAAGYSNRTGNYGLEITLQTTQPIVTGNLAPGDYYVLVKTDSDSALPESNETNNVVASTTPITITAISRPDLTIAGSTPSQDVYIDSTIPVSFTVTNSATIDAARSGWFDSVFLSNDNVFDVADVSLASISRAIGQPDLAPGASYTVNSNVTLPAGVTGGKYLIFVTDRTNNRLESNETNNQSIVALNIVAPDLVVTAPVTVPAIASKSETINVSWLIKNQGTAATNVNWYDRIFLSSDQTLSANDIAVSDRFNNTSLSINSTYTATQDITIPNSAALGAQYLLFVADGYGNQKETNNDNNVFAAAIAINAPDLTLTAATAPIFGSIGQNVDISWTVVNQGEGVANADHYDYVYVSTDTTLDGNDTFVASEYITTNLTSGANYAVTKSFTLPNTAVGDRYLLFVTDGNNAQGETNESNNIRAVAFSVRNNASDLIINGEPNAPSSVSLGEAVNVSWKVKNAGLEPANADHLDRIYISNNATLDAGDTLLSQVTVTTDLGIEEEYTNNQSFEIPLTASGDRFLLFVADANNNQFESNENNNVTAKAIRVNAADLQISALTTPTSAMFGDAINVGWTVNNAGTGNAPKTWSDRLYLSRTNTIDSSAILLSSAEASNLSTAQSYQRTVTPTLPLNVNLAAGTYYLILATDADNIQPESAENNNLQFRQISLALPPLPDLVVSSVTAPSSEFSGRNVLVTWAITNQGTADATGTWYDNIYASTDNVAGNDYYFGSYSFTGTIAAGQSVTRSQEVTLPINWSGDRWFVVITDGGNSINELTNENNNTTVAAQPINIQLSPFPNLQVTEVTPPSASFSGAETQISWKVKNVGSGATNTSYWYDQVWLSQDSILDVQGDYLLGTLTNPSYLNPNDIYTNTLTAKLPRSVDGNWRIIVNTDAGNRVYEYDKENDNITASTPFNITLTPPADLQVTKVNIVPSSPFSGQKVTVNWTVKNTGLGRTVPGESAWTDELLIAKNIDGTDDAISLGRFDHNGFLDTNTEYNNSKQVDLPIGKYGDYFFIVRTDVNNRVFEQAFEDNNSGFLDANKNDNIDTPSIIKLTPPPDLTVLSVTVANNAIAGKSLNVSYSVGNEGATAIPARTPSWTDTVYFSLTNTFDRATAIRMGSKNHTGVLNAGDAYTDSIAVNLPVDFTAGVYYLFVATDDSQQIFEADDAYPTDPLAFLPNVKLAGQVTIASKPADFVVTSVIPPATLTAGKNARISWSVLNQGTGDSVSLNWNDRLVASVDNILGNGDDTTLGEFNRNQGQLFVGGTYKTTQDVAIPFALSGNYNLFVTTDSSNQVYESAQENNNDSASVAITISRQTPDLEVDQVTAPTTAIAATTIPISWRGKNTGVGVTNVDYWYDQVYLSTDQVLNYGDTPIGTIYHSGVLGVGENYTGNASVTIPTNIAGDFYVIVKTDDSAAYNIPANRVLEISEDNNTAVSSKITISLNPVPDLIVTTVDAAATAISGQAIAVNWTVKNNDAATTATWRDGVYLSRDQVFDRYTDAYLGTTEHTGGLGAGQSYSQSKTFNLPRGLSGAYYAFVATDNGYYGNSEVYERNGESNNVSYDLQPTQIILPPPTDLVPTAITIPTGAIAGQNIQLSFTVANQGGESALGSWTDTLYLSSDNVWDINDTKIGEVAHSGDVAAASNYTGSLSAILPGVTPGNYHVIVRSDIRDQVPETSNTNNTFATTNTLNVDFATLNVGSSVNGTLAQGQSVYYKMQGTAGKAVRLQFDSVDNESANGLFVRYGQVPTRGQFDRTSDSPFLADPDIIVPTQDGTYYILAYGNVETGAPNYTLTATEIPFSITKVESNVVGNVGKATIKVKGALFEEGTTFQLVDQSGSAINQVTDKFKDSTINFVTFDLAGKTAGLYNLKATQTNGATTVFNNSVTVQTGIGSINNEAIDGPPRVWAGQKYPVSVNYGNSGDTDGLAPVIILSVDNAAVGITPRYDANALKNRPLQLLGVGTDIESTVLRPREAHSIPVYFTSFAAAGAPAPAGTGGFSAISHSADEGYAVSSSDWDVLKTSSKPTGIADGEWNGFWSGLQPSIGTTWGDYVKFTNGLSKTYSAAIAAQGDNQYDSSELFRELYNQKPNFHYSGNLTGKLLDVTVAANNDANPNNDVGLAGQKVQARDASGKIVGEGTSDANGIFTIPYLQSGTYSLDINYDTTGQQYFFNQDKGEFTYRASLPPQVTIAQNANGVVDTDTGNLFVRGDIPKDQNIGIVQENNPRLVKGSDGVSHLFWSRNGFLVHTYQTPTGWSNAETVAQLPEGSGSVGYDIKAASNLINGTDAGLMITFQGQPRKDGVPEKVYYSVGRSKVGGGYEFSSPNALTNDNIADTSPSVVINNNGQAVVVYQRQNTAIKDDSDLYFNILDVDGNGISWLGNGSNLAINTSGFASNLSDLVEDPSNVKATAQRSFSRNIQKKGITIPLVNQSLDFEGNIGGSGTITTDDCYEKDTLEGKAALKVTTVPPKVSPADRNIWKPTVKVSGSLDFGGSLTTETECGKTTGSGQAFVNLGGGVEVSWSLATLISLVIRTGVAATGTPLIIAGPIIDFLAIKAEDALKGAGIEASAGVEGKASAGATAKYKDGKWENPVGVFKAEVNAFGKGKGGGTEVKASLGAALTQEFYLYTADLSDFDFKLGKGKLQGQAILEIKVPDKTVEQWKFSFDAASWAETDDPNTETLFAGNGAAIQRTFYFDPNDLIGSTNVYFNNGNNSVVSDITSDVLDDYNPVTAKGANGEIILGSFKNVDFSQVNQMGSEVTVSTLVGNQWSIPIAIANSLGYNQDLVLNYDNANRPIAVWSMASSAGLGVNLTAAQHDSALAASDIVFSTYQGGTWTAPTKVIELAGKDSRVASGVGVNGELIITWDNQYGNLRTNHTLQSAIWNGTSWSTPTAIASGSELLGTASISTLNGKTAIFWTQTDKTATSSSLVDSPEASSHIYYSLYEQLGWTTPTLFVPTFAPAPTGSGSNLTTASDLLTEQPSFAGGGGSGGAGGANCGCAKCKNTYCPPPLRSSDPNDIIGPQGFGAEQWTNVSAPYGYTIRFENVDTATAPAKIVTITQQLDSDLDWRSFRLGSFTFGDVAIQAPENTPFYSDRIDVVAQYGVYVDISATIDIRTGIATWEFRAIDPETGDLPTDPLKGFLPPNIVKGAGEGNITYTVKVKNSAVTGDRIDAEAQIIFDTNEPINTPPIFNTIDKDAPISNISTPVIQTLDPNIPLNFLGNDLNNGSGISGYNIYYSDNGSAYDLLVENTPLTEGTFVGELGRTYSFYALALDNAGNIQAESSANIVNVVVGGPGTLDFSNVAYSVNEAGVAIAAVTVTRSNGSSGAISAQISLSDGTATGGKQPFGNNIDYDNTPIVVNFSDGQTSKVVNIPIHLDSLTEGDETINLVLGSPTGGAILGNQTTATLTIIDDSTQLNFADTNFRLNENGTATKPVTIIRTGRLDKAVSVTLGFNGGTAGAADFNSTPITVDFAINQTSQVVTIPITNDSLIEGNETINLTLSNPTNGAVVGSGNNAVALVVDDDVNLKFNLTPDVGMSETAIAGFANATKRWATLFNNSVTINLNIGFRDLGLGVLGQNVAQRDNYSYSSVYNALGVNRSSADDNTAFSNLQTGNNFDMLLNRTANSPNGSGSATPYLDNDDDANNSTIRLNRGNAKALGLVNANATGQDSTIIFNSSSSIVWDFDPTDGISVGAYDFVGLVTHEIGHALGFDSGVDVLDGSVPSNDNEYTYASALDLFRFSADSLAQGSGVIDWTASNTDKYFSINGGTTKIASFATGINYGDGQQASHWKNGLGIGLMDPNISLGERLDITDTDRKAFDVIGWNLGSNPAPSDFGGDRKSEILWRNGSGNTVIWSVDGSTVTSDSLLTAKPGYTAKSASDYDGDGKADILWRNQTTGENEIWFMNGNTVASKGNTSSAANPTWYIEGAGDFNGDRKSDILWRSSVVNPVTNDSYVVIWTMDRTTETGEVTKYQNLDLKQNSGFAVKAVGDFDGDGKSDIFWRNQATGQNEIWFMNGATVLNKGFTSAGADPTWSVVGSGDFNGDGKTDILWRNRITDSATNDNYVVIWLMNGLAETGLVTLNQNGGNLKQTVNFGSQAVGDYNGDGKADIFWHDPQSHTGQIWSMTGVAANSIVPLSIPNDFNIVSI